MNAVQKLANLLLYSSVFVAFGAVSLVQLSIELAGGRDPYWEYSAFTFFSVILLYSVHRIIGMNKVGDFDEAGRFAIITKYQHHIRIYGLAGAFGAMYYFLGFDWKLQALITFPAALSLLYVIPFLPGRRRLRDIHLVKIFTIALVWSWVTSFIPNYLVLGEISMPVGISFLERALFIFAITIPFDIRDMEVDAHTGVHTIPATLGIAQSKRLALGCLALHLIIAFYLSQSGYYPAQTWQGLLLFFLVTGILIYKSGPGWSDYYYSGVLDGTMILQWLIVSGWLYLFS